jgi:hypothetical protein
VRHGARRHVDDRLAVPVDDEAPGVGDLADHGGLDVPLRADREERVDLVRLDDRAHALLRLAHEDLLRSERGVAQRDRSSTTCMPPSPLLASSEVAHEMPAPPRSWMPSTSRREHLERALDEQLLHERVAHLHARGAWSGRRRSKVSEARTETPPMPSPPVFAP